MSSPLQALLIKQINFEHWANTELAKTLFEAQPLDERALTLFSHLLSSSNMWISRIHAIPMTVTLFQERTLEECKAMIDINTAAWIKYLQSADDAELNRIIDFIFPIDGSARRMSAMDAVMHIVHHSSYHRGQIIARVKGSVPVLPLVTYIVYATETIA